MVVYIALATSNNLKYFECSYVVGLKMADGCVLIVDLSLMPSHDLKYFESTQSCCNPKS